jgi:hypothetical protein
MHFASQKHKFAHQSPVRAPSAPVHNLFGLAQEEMDQRDTEVTVPGHPVPPHPPLVSNLVGQPLAFRHRLHFCNIYYLRRRQLRAARLPATACVSKIAAQLGCPVPCPVSCSGWPRLLKRDNFRVGKNQGTTREQDDTPWKFSPLRLHRLQDHHR